MTKIDSEISKGISSIIGKSILASDNLVSGLKILCCNCEVESDKKLYEQLIEYIQFQRAID